MSKRLPEREFIEVVRNAPLVSVDFIVENERGEIGLGERRNEPAKGKFYFPGGRIRKDEPIEFACGRIVQDELGLTRKRGNITLIGVNNWFFGTNAFGIPGLSTHYVALAFRLKVKEEEVSADAFLVQHSRFGWFTVAQLLADKQVHEDVKHVMRFLEDEKANHDIDKT